MESEAREWANLRGFTEIPVAHRNWTKVNLENTRPVPDVPDMPLDSGSFERSTNGVPLAMASVAICPHCYLQLVVPDGVEPDEQVECPTCAKAFGLDEAVLRAIPEVVRRPHSASQSADSSLSESAAKAIVVADELVVEEIVEEVVEVDSLSADLEASADLDTMRQFEKEAAEQEEAEVVEQIKARIEEELASGDLLPGMSASLSLETPAGLDEFNSPDELDAESSDQSHRPTIRLNELTRLRGEFDIDEAEEESVESVAEVPIETEAADESPSVVDDADAPAEISLESEPIQSETEEPETAEQEPELAEPPVARPAATTLADLMPPAEVSPVAEGNQEQEEPDEALGPSFELPNVPLTPTSATVEFDPNETFGPAAESEFSLDQVDFDAEPIEAAAEYESSEYEPTEYEPTDEFESGNDDSDSYDSADYDSDSYEPAAEGEDTPTDDEPVFSEPAAAPQPATPFVLPGLPRKRKKRSVVRLLVGTALGGLVGITLGYGVLLYVLGPEGDILQVAKYLPSTVLPPSFRDDAPSVVAENAITENTIAQAAPPVDTTQSTEAQSNDSATQPATFTEEVTPPETSSPPDILAEDDRYGGEPSPLDEPAAEPISAAKLPDMPAPLPLRGETYTVDDLATALATGESALKGLVSGNLSDATVRRTKGMSYAKLCDLAQALTFVDRSQPSVESEQAIDSSMRLFHAALADPHTRDEVNRIATIWIDSPHRQHGGVFLAGEVAGGEIAGDVYQYRLTGEDGGDLTLLAAEPLDSLAASSAHPVAVVGSIVENAGADVTGYRGAAKRAIWVTRAIPLE
jgi:hypothetical protein